MVGNILSNKKEYCIGNFSIELPEGMIMDEETKPVIRFDDIKVTTQRLYLPSFEQRVQLREDELVKTMLLDPGNGHYLKAVYPLENGEKGVIYERMESLDIPDSERMLEAHSFKDGVAFIVELKTRNETSERYSAEVKQYPELGGENVPQKLSELKSYLG